MFSRRPFTCAVVFLLIVLALVIWFVPPGRYPLMSQSQEITLQLTALPSLAVLPTMLSSSPDPTLSAVNVNLPSPTNHILQPTIASLSDTSLPSMTTPIIILPTIALDSGEMNSVILAPQSNKGQYIVQRGDTLYRIAVAYGITAETLADMNGLLDPSRIFVGQVLIVPVGIVSSTVLTSVSSSATPIYPTPDLPTMNSILVPPVATDLGILKVTPVPMSSVSNVNGVPIDALIVIPETVRQNIALIYAQGRELGRNPRAFSKLGDSTIENPHFLTRFDGGPYTLGVYAFLQPVIDYFQGSFGRQGVAVQRGLHSWSVFDPMWGDKSQCMGAETVIACEFRLNNPSYLFIRLGSNDVGVPESFDRNIRQVVEFSIQNGVIPIIGTKADRHEGPGNVNNAILRQIASDYQIPLWDFDLVAATVPGRGLGPDGVHMTTFFAHDYSSPVAFQRGNGIHSLTALMALDSVWRSVDAMAR